VKRLAAAAVVAALLLSGCADKPGSLDDGIESVPATELIGLWRVSDAAGEGDETWLLLGEEVVLWNDCGLASGSWDARDDAFIAEINSWAGDSCAVDDFPADWLVAAAGYGFIDDKLSLVDASGSRVATLTLDGTPPIHPDWSDEYREQPDKDEVAKFILREGVPLPDVAVPADDLVGKWLPTDYNGSIDPHLTFADDGQYVGWDGCNGFRGRWVYGAQGSILTTSGASTAVWCDGSNAAYEIASADTLGMVGDELTLFGYDGEVLAAFIRA